MGCKPAGRSHANANQIFCFGWGEPCQHLSFLYGGSKTLRWKSIIDLAAWVGLAALLWTLLPTAMLPEVVGAAVDAFFLYVREIGAAAMGYVTDQMSQSPNAMRAAAGAILVLFVASICRWIVQVRMQVRAEEAGRVGEAREARRDASHAEGSWTAQANGDMP